MASKSNKTAHVLNLLTNTKDAAQDTGKGDTDTQQAKPVPGVPLVPPILEVARAKDDAVSECVRNALEAELNDYLSEETEDNARTGDRSDAELPQPEPELPAAAPEVPQQENEENIMERPIQQPALSDASAQELPSAPLPDQAAPAGDTVKHADPAPFTYVNIMQALVEENADKYIEMFHVCKCARCAADVRALALCNLPAKYAVMRKGDLIPMLTVYDGRYHASVTAQLMQACKTVLEFPRHDL